MQITKQFVIAGNAQFTVSNPNGAGFKYQIKRSSRESRANQQGLLLVYAFAENGRRLYVGRLDARSGEVSVGRRSRVSETALMYSVVRWACNVLWMGSEFPAGYRAESVGRCGRCGRMVNSGQLFGPECRQEARHSECRTHRTHTLPEAVVRLTGDTCGRRPRRNADPRPSSETWHTTDGNVDLDMALAYMAQGDGEVSA